MRSFLLATVLAAAPLAAFAQSGTLSPAPVPSIPPPMASNGAPSPVPERIAGAPGASSAGPASATPFSSAPSSLLPHNGEGTTTLAPIGGNGATTPTPDLSR